MPTCEVVEAAWVEVQDLVRGPQHPGEAEPHSQGCGDEGPHGFKERPVLSSALNIKDL